MSTRFRISPTPRPRQRSLHILYVGLDGATEGYAHTASGPVQCRGGTATHLWDKRRRPRTSIRLAELRRVNLRAAHGAGGRRNALCRSKNQRRAGASVTRAASTDPNQRRHVAALGVERAPGRWAARRPYHHGCGRGLPH